MKRGQRDSVPPAEPPAVAGTPGPGDGPQPHCEFAFGARVQIGGVVRMGPSKLGLRQQIPILGGRVAGALSGEVLPGVDDQLVRADGVLQLDARYAIRSDDGALVVVHNRALFHAKDGQPYFRCAPEFEAPEDGPHAWLNRTIFVGDARITQPGAVDIRFFKLV